VKKIRPGSNAHVPNEGLKAGNADADFFLALLKEKDRLKEKALKLLEEYRGDMKTSLTTFIELMLLSKRYGSDPVRVTEAGGLRGGKPRPSGRGGSQFSLALLYQFRQYIVK